MALRFIDRNLHAIGDVAAEHELQHAERERGELRLAAHFEVGVAGIDGSKPCP
jgi:hypothetical protein